MTLSIIIVNYNVKFFLEKCLQSVTAAIAGIETEVFVVDNCSSDGSPDYIQPRFPAFHYLRNEVNTGFAKANNQALAKATGKYVLFLNPDTVVGQNDFTACIGFMESHPEAGALGVKMMNGHGVYLRESKRGFPSPLTAFWKLTGMAALFPHSAVFARYYLGHLDENRVSEVDVLSGAFLFARKETLDITGGFDERFFMYAEDIDLSYRIVQSGYKNYYYPVVTILHYKGQSTKKDVKYVNLFYKAMSQFVKKYHGRGAFTLFLDAGIWLRAGIEHLKLKSRK